MMHGRVIPHRKAPTFRVSSAHHENSVCGRSGTIQTPDRLLDVTLGNPLEKGIGKRGPNSELLFAGAYSACYHGALINAAKKFAIPVKNSAVRALVSLIEDEGRARYSFGSNSSVRARRARIELGWSPKHASLVEWIEQEMPITPDALPTPASTESIPA